MKTKNILVSFLAIVFVLALVASVSASAPALATITNVKVDSVALTSTDSSQVIQAGSEVAVKVYFTALMDDKDVTVKVTLDTGKQKAEAETVSFRVAKDSSYVKGLVVKVPYELKDELSNDVSLEVEIEGKDGQTSVEYNFIVERPQYAFAIKSITADQKLKAGETFPVDVVISNAGYYDLEDVYVTVSIADLGVKKTGYFNDLFALEGERTYVTTFANGSIITNVEGDEDNEDTVSGKLYLEIPEDAKQGIYTLEVTAENEDVTLTKAIQLVIENAFETTVFKSGNSLWIVNPTDNVVGYRIVPQSPASVSESLVFVPAGASKEIAVTSNSEGEYSFDVGVFTTSGDLVKAVNFSGKQGSDDNSAKTTDPIVILTVILAVVFIVLLIVLIVLIGKKPEKSGEFGESYY